MALLDIPKMDESVYIVLMHIKAGNGYAYENSFRMEGYCSSILRPSRVENEYTHWAC